MLFRSYASQLTIGTTSNLDELHNTEMKIDKVVDIAKFSLRRNLFYASSPCLSLYNSRKIHTKPTATTTEQGGEAFLRTADGNRTFTALAVAGGHHGGAVQLLDDVPCLELAIS